MKKEYIKPSIKVVVLSDDDLIVTSPKMRVFSPNNEDNPNNPNTVDSVW